MVIESFLRNFLFFMSFSHWNRIIVCMNYLYYEYKSSTVCTVKEDEKLYYKSLSTQNYLNEKCLLNGSTLKGRQEAFVYQMKVRKYIPVVVSISRKEIYFPNKSKKAHDCIWINYANIKDVTYFESTCTITFHDGSKLDCEHPKRIQQTLKQIFRYLNKNTPD
jgi:comK protein